MTGAGSGFVAEKRWGSAWCVGSPAIAGFLRVVLFGVAVGWLSGRRAAVLLVFGSVNQVLVRLWARPAAATDRMVGGSPCGSFWRPAAGRSVQRRVKCAEWMACRVAGPLHRHPVRSDPGLGVMGCGWFLCMVGDRGFSLVEGSRVFSSAIRAFGGCLGTRRR